MKTLTTITGREIKVTPNNNKRTFTLRVSSGKFRTLPMSKEEFNNASMFWTGNDWQNFLNSSDEYYVVR